MIINKKYTFPRYFHVKLMQCETLSIEQFFYGFCKRNWKEWCTLLRHMAMTQVIELNRIQSIYIGKSIAIYQIEKKGYQ